VSLGAVCEHEIFINHLRENHQVYSFGALGEKMKCFDFEVKRSKVKFMANQTWHKKLLPIKFCLVQLYQRLSEGNLQRMPM